jgi:rhomboid protease GluP
MFPVFEPGDYRPWALFGTEILAALHRPVSKAWQDRSGWGEREMPPNTTFGKRVQTQARAMPVARAAPVRAVDLVPNLPAAPWRAEQDELPFLTAGLIAMLGIVFLAEVNRNGGTAMAIRLPTLIELGGSSGQLVFGAHQWWRIFTAPMLHGGLSHLIGNCVALFFAGRYLEPVIGLRWFGALYAICAVAGSLTSLGEGAAITVSVGASGAITGLLAATLFCSYRMEDATSRKRMRMIALRIFVPAVLPAFLPGHGAGHVDYGAHVGGAVAGFAVAILLTMLWDKQVRRPRLPSLASAIAVLAAVCTAGGFALAMVQGGVAVAAAAPSRLIPQNEVPKDNAEGLRRYADLVERYPRDPRGHYFRAEHFFNQGNMAEATEELRKALALAQAQPEAFPSHYTDTLKMTLGLVIRAEGNPEAAHAMAQEACNRADANPHLRQTLQAQKICD